MEFSIVSPLFFNTLTDKNNPDREGLRYTVTVTPASVEYSFPMNQEPVIRALISQKEAIAFQARKLKPEQAAKYAKQVDSLIKKNPFLKNYAICKTVMMNCIQDRTYAIEKRFLLMNFMMKSMQNLIDNKKESEVYPFALTFLNHNDRDEIINYFKSIRPNFAFSVMDALSMLHSLPSTEKFDKVRSRVFSKLGYKDDCSDFGTRPFDAMEKDYINMKANFYENIIKQGKEDSKEYYLENIMVGFIWSMNFPYAEFTLSLWDNFAFFNIMFNVIKVLLTVYVNDDTFDDDVVTAISALDESFRSVSNGLVKTTISVLNDRGFNTNGDMAVLAMS